MHLHYFVLSLLTTLPSNADHETQRAVLPPHAAPGPLSAATPETIPTAHARLPPRPKPASQAWMLSVEGATRVPVDVGVQATLASPFHLRFSAGYGWVPTAYSSLFTSIAISASSDADVAAILSDASYQGRTFRAAIGVRPLATAGLHLDVGYARLSLAGALELAGSGAPTLAGLSGGYRAHTTVDAWSVEVGSQVEGWGVVLGIAFGLMRTFASRTTISAVDGAPASSSLAPAAQQTDAALKSYGYVPTFTLRLGFDVLAPRSWASDRGSPG